MNRPSMLLGVRARHAVGLMLDIRGASPGLLDDPLLLEVGGAPPNAALTWRARLRDDDGFVWRAAAPTSEGLSTAWVPAKPTAGPVAALRSLRPVDVDVRVEGTDGAASSRTITRRLTSDGVRARRWRDDIVGTLYLPAETTNAALILDARPPPQPPSRDDLWSPTAHKSSLDAPDAGGAAGDAAHAPLAAALLASRGVLAFVLIGGKGDAIGSARERLTQIPGTPHEIVALDAAAVPVPAGVGLRGEDQKGAIARAGAWDDLLKRLSARPRVTR
jgi:hypothetical protein